MLQSCHYRNQNNVIQQKCSNSLSSGRPNGGHVSIDYSCISSTVWSLCQRSASLVHVEGIFTVISLIGSTQCYQKYTVAQKERTCVRCFVSSLLQSADKCLTSLRSRSHTVIPAFSSRRLPRPDKYTAWTKKTPTKQI